LLRVKKDFCYVREFLNPLRDMEASMRTLGPLVRNSSEAFLIGDVNRLMRRIARPARSLRDTRPVVVLLITVSDAAPGGNSAGDAALSIGSVQLANRVITGACSVSCDTAFGVAPCDGSGAGRSFGSAGFISAAGDYAEFPWQCAYAHSILYRSEGMLSFINAKVDPMKVRLLKRTVTSVIPMKDSICESAELMLWIPLPRFPRQYHYWVLAPQNARDYTARP
ncbi:hypothetical protein BBP40_012058, partial [Aspergillus hancockii]